MTPLEEEIKSLTQKIELMYLMIEELTHRFSDSIAVNRSLNNSPAYPNFLVNSAEFHQPQMTYSHLDPSQEYNEFILHEKDGNRSMFNHPEQEGQKDLQIQRLTAQLTAAYNRIAALEEQLLTHRIHH